MVSSNNPSGSSECQSIGGTTLFVCRGTGGTAIPANIPSGGTACMTSGSDTWCVYTNNTTGTSCIGPTSNDGSSFGSHVNNIWVCKAPGTTGNQVTVQNQSYTRISQALG